jgi:hypothetical protein
MELFLGPLGKQGRFKPCLLFQGSWCRSIIEVKTEKTFGVGKSASFCHSVRSLLIFFLHYIFSQHTKSSSIKK